ncbi:hypothetical protein ASPZODRAFT_138497 [Penicilliopsis zonata CBS 506.65]|uniref:Mediator of RNA polymerase II transcription subunit 9 n=1 Tax=Penicilliopsis zonata CBS 506.65 TaxID=1073090 RepID=A0A1L9SW41_9EURO|nr:hypothetical protein ASPZODRAFT_138497 [Penicilliopsis zonata CBS 506.65]OJJ51399.1 hypothetical protein ASPZODRAFT_138497 [Penicilliopsis zonata CBS 506.65]
MASRSPTALTPLPKASSAPQTPAIAVSSPTQPVSFPPPQTFDIIPPLHGLLCRLLSPHTTGASDAARGATDTVGQPSLAVPTQAQQQPSVVNDNRNQILTGAPQQMLSSSATGVTASASSTAVTGDIGPNALPSLDAKDLPTESSAIKIRIQKARAVVDSLPDVHRSVTEQEREMKDLEDRIARLRSVIADFGSRAGGETLT